MARSVESQRGSVGEMKRMSGMRRDAASSASEPGAWTKTRRAGSQNRLKMGMRGVADPNRARAHVPLEVRQRLLGELVPAVDAVHDLERAVGPELIDPRHDPAHERFRLAGVAEPHEGIEGEGRVADPGI